MTKKRTRTTVGEAISEIERLRLKKAVVNEVDKFLSQFVSSDSYEPDKGIASPVSAGVVPQDVIEEVRFELGVWRDECTLEAEELLSYPVKIKAQRRKNGVEKRKEESD